MAKQLVKGMTMVALLVAIALVTAVASASGQSRTSRADVPFEFVAGNTTLSAGHYQISNASAGGEVLRITAMDQGQSVFSLSTAMLTGEPMKEGKLVFRRYASHYFLAEIWVPGEVEGRKLPKSRAEKSIERELASIRSKKGSGQSNYERVEIALVKK